MPECTDFWCRCFDAAIDAGEDFDDAQPECRCVLAVDDDDVPHCRACLAPMRSN